MAYCVGTAPKIGQFFADHKQKLYHLPNLDLTKNHDFDHSGKRFKICIISHSSIDRNTMFLDFSELSK